MTAQLKEMPSPFSRRIGATVRSLMARHGVKQVQLARVLGVNQSGVSYRLNGRTPFDVNELATVARLFQMTVAELVQDAEQPRPDGPDRGLLDAAHPERLELPTFCVGNDAIVIPFPAQPSITTGAVNGGGIPCAVTDLASA